MSLGDRPYIGTWKLGAQKLVQHTPDALVFINGDMALPGCQRCNSRIDLQRFITEVSVDAGCDAGGASASLTLAIPAHHRDSFIRDSQFILRAGLEVHIYMRGYFPVKGLYSNLNNTVEAPVPSKQAPSSTQEAAKPKQGEGAEPGNPDPISNPRVGTKLTRRQWKALYEDDFRKAADILYPGEGEEMQFVRDRFVAQSLIWSFGESMLKSDPQHAVVKPGDAIFGQPGEGDAGSFLQKTSLGRADPKLGKTPDGKWGYFKYAKWSSPVAAAVGHAQYQQKYLSKPSDPYGFEGFSYYNTKSMSSYKTSRREMGILEKDGKYYIPPKNGRPATDPVTKEVEAKEAPALAQLGPGVLDTTGLSGYDLENLLAYPYYQVFHGVVTQASHSYQAGVTTATVNCSSLLYFWQFQQMSSNASVFGPRPPNSGNKISRVGNNFTGMHPYEIIYTLHQNTAGAAQGVNWVYSQKGNQTAASSLTNESFFSLATKYWERRFSLRDIKLRMHGITGELFSTLQAAFLSKLDANELTKLVRGRFNNTGGTQQRGSKVFSQAYTLGLYNGRKLNALIQADKSRPPTAKNQRLEINMAEMQAFQNDISQWGQFQLFESTYETKLDIANKVCEVTGFEFYQDVDGDFVFKPPMYNLDTSSSRVYRVEDIDIISINFDDKEPQVTYMTCKGSHFTNTKGVGLENEWGVQGQYIDYRLVAQFGWRPGNFESGYFTNPESMFFAAVNRLDVMNAPTKSASVTIPLRPELRPGYPVYIPYLDAFYYCNSFAHSFSVGGSCQTTLQLIAKRGKFFAPGNPTQRGIESIDLSNTLLPEKPLEVLDNNGRPRLSGFPNVVMALDPKEIDPLFFIVGTDVEDVQDESTLRTIMQRAMEMGIVVSYPDPTRPGPYYKYHTTSTGQDVFFYFDKAPNTVKGNIVKPKGGAIVDLQTAANAYASKKAQINKQLDKRISKIQAAQQKAAASSEAARKLAQGNSSEAAQNKAESKAEADKAAAERLAQEAKDFERKQTEGLSTNTASQVAQFKDLLDQVNDKIQRPSSFQSRFGGGDPNSSITLLEMLSDKKAIFSTKSLPGTYRYYSASHPDPAQQGQDYLTLNITKEAKTMEQKVVLEPSKLTDSLRPIPTYVQNPATTPNGLKPEAEFKSAMPKRGIRVYTADTKANGGIKTLATSDIRELMFACHHVIKESPRQTKGAAETTVLSGAEFVQAWRQEADEQRGSPLATNTLTEAMSKWTASVNDAIKAAVESARAQQKTSAGKSAIPAFPIPQPPAEVIYLGGHVLTTVPLNQYTFVEGPGPLGDAWPGSDAFSVNAAWSPLASAYGYAYYTVFLDALSIWKDNVRASLKVQDQTQLGTTTFDEILSLFLNSLASSTGVRKVLSQPKIAATLPKKIKGKKRGKVGNGRGLISTPVFPISDAKGYHVIGSYRYGRDVDIDPEGVFDVLHRQDIFSMLDKNLVDKVLNAFVRGDSIIASHAVTLPGGTKVTKGQKLSGPLAKSYVEQEVIAVLRKNYSDNDILAMGKGRMTATGLEIGLSNWITDEKNSTSKIPLNNAAYSLADLTPYTSRNFCSCKAAEASVLLDIAGTQDFVQFTDAGRKEYNTPNSEASVDRTVQWVQRTTQQVSIPWSQSQAALRGSAPEGPRTSIIDAARTFTQQREEQARQLDNAQKALDASLKAASTNYEAITKK